MTFDTTHFFEIAQDLYSMASGSAYEEGLYRSAIGRAYYAVFREAREYLRQKKGITTIPDNSYAHTIIRKELLKLSTKEHKKVENYLDLLRTSRNKADYELSYPNLSLNADNALKWAERSLNILEILP
jgi:uncharacterized protein (UPF0332 family)